MKNKHIRVLLIEDNPGDRRLIQEYLSDIKGHLFNIENTEYLSNAFDLLDKKNFDIILLDLTLPDSTGFETFVRTFSKAPMIPIIVLTGNDDEDLAIKTVRFGAQDYLIKGKIDGNLLVRCIRYAIERKQAERHQQLVTQILKLLNQPTDKTNVIRDMLLLIKEFTGFESIAIRLKEGEDYPYYETSGFSSSFIETEKYLLSRDQNGNIIRDLVGKPYLECMCGNIISGRTNPDLSCFTEGGSFWTNDLSNFFSSASEKDHLTKLRGRCLEEDYKSVGLIPLKSDNEIIGLLQLNDHRKDMFTPEMIIFFEGLAASIGIALARKQNEEEILKLNRELEERVRKRTEQLTNMNEELEAFSYSISHDLRAPLRAIDGFTNILFEDYEKFFDEEGKRLCSVIHQNTQNMSQLIIDLLSFSRVSRTNIAPILFEMEILVNSIYHVLTTEEERKRIRFNIERLPNVVGDPNMIKLVWTNLISNAIKFSSKQENPVINVSSETKGDETIYYIRDNGVGFDMEYVDKLFGVFQRLHSAKDFEGTGVGLAIVHRIIKRHGGRVWAKSEINKGATFFFSMPIKEDKNE
jgi:signal transduction histidine kinase/DNA-binding response OmpR family regulator